MSNTDFVGRAIDVVKKAVDSDTAEEYEKAYELYYNARKCRGYHRQGVLAKTWTNLRFPYLSGTLSSCTEM